MSFPKRGESSKKGKRRSDDCFYKKIAKLEKEKKALKKSNATLRQRVHRMKKKKQKDTNQVLTQRKSVSNILRRGGLSPGKASNYIVKTLLFAEVVSEEIRASVLERKNNGGSIRRLLRLLSGKILRKYKLSMLLKKPEIIGGKCVAQPLRILTFKARNEDLIRKFTLKC